MPVGEVILGAIGEFIGYILVEVIIERIGKLIRAIYYRLRKLITGNKREFSEFKRIEKRYRYKKIKLKTDFNEQILKGTQGTVMEIIDEQNVFVEFENSNGIPFTEASKQVFKIERKRITLERRKQTQNKV